MNDDWLNQIAHTDAMEVLPRLEEDSVVWWDYKRGNTDFPGVHRGFGTVSG